MGVCLVRLGGGRSKEVTFALILFKLNPRFFWRCLCRCLCSYSLHEGVGMVQSIIVILNFGCILGSPGGV